MRNGNQATVDIYSTTREIEPMIVLSTVTIPEHELLTHRHLLTRAEFSIWHRSLLMWAIQIRELIEFTQSFPSFHNIRGAKVATIM